MGFERKLQNGGKTVTQVGCGQFDKKQGKNINKKYYQVVMTNEKIK